MSGILYVKQAGGGFLSATEDKKRETVVDLIKEKSRKDLFPVGRLDLDTEGLLLITNDGELAHQLLAPKNHVDKVYYARCKGRPDEEAIRQFEAGFVLPDGLSCLPAGLKVLDSKDLPEGGRGWLGGNGFGGSLITLREGKFHQVKRMMEAAGCPVLYFKTAVHGADPAGSGFKAGGIPSVNRGRSGAVEKNDENGFIGRKKSGSF